MTALANLPARLRRIRPGELVTITLHGAPAAVAALARTLAAVTDVTGMRHTATPTGGHGPAIRIEVTCAPRTTRRPA